MWRFCSEEEGRDRLKENDVHPLERLDFPALAVRKFIRSDGTDRHLAYPRRSIPQLEATNRHLFGLWTDAVGGRDDAAESAAYSFVMDRLAAVRQELSVYANETTTTDRLGLLAPMCRFYTYLQAYCMRENAGWFDATLHESALQGCLSSALSALPCSIAFATSSESNNVRDELEACVSALQLQTALRSACLHSPSVPALVSSLMSLRLPLVQNRRHLGGEGQDVVFAVIGALRCGSASGAVELIQGSASAPPRLAFLFMLLRCCLPALQALRLGLADCSANKGEALPLARMAAMLGTSEAAAGALAELWARREEGGQGGFVLRPKAEAGVGAGRLSGTVSVLSREGQLPVSDFFL